MFTKARMETAGIALGVILIFEIGDNFFNLRGMLPRPAPRSTSTTSGS